MRIIFVYKVTTLRIVLMLVFRNRVAREVGTEGKLGGQARVANVGGTWKDLTDNVNVMANNVSFYLRTSSFATYPNTLL